MNKVLLLGVLVCGCLMFAGCATPGPMGIVVTKIKTPIGLNDPKLNVSRVSKAGLKQGSATCWSSLGLFAGGDNTIQAAAKEGGIKKVLYADYTVSNWFGFYGKYTVTVYGE